MEQTNQLDRRSFLGRSVMASLSAGFFRVPGLFPRSHETLCGIDFEILRYAWRTPRRYLFIHGDEPTAHEILTSYMYDHDGVAYLVKGTGRDVEINGLKIDPNRLFSRAGAERSLRAENPAVDPVKMTEVLDLLDRQREKLVRALTPGPGSRLIALHNNRDYSVKDEVAQSNESSLRQMDRPGDFILCTSPADYAILKQSPYNVVLQSSPDPDDGSLSRLAARRGFRYLNIECAVGDYEAQQERLRWIDDRLP
jgi:hypothetical protein